jgi:hypothetical protein
VRLMRVAIQRNTALEERLVAEREHAIQEVDALRADLVKIAQENARPGRRGRAAREIEERFAHTALPRSVQRITVRGSGGAESLEQTFRGQREWTEDAKRALIARGYAAADSKLQAHGVDPLEQAS